MAAVKGGRVEEGEDGRSARLPQGWPAGTVWGQALPREVVRRAVQPARLERRWTSARAGRVVVEGTVRPAPAGWPPQAPVRAGRVVVEGTVRPAPAGWPPQAPVRAGRRGAGPARPGWPARRSGAAEAGAVASSPPAPEVVGRAGQLSGPQAERVARRGRLPARPVPLRRRGLQVLRRQEGVGQRHPKRLRSGRRRDRNQASPGHNPHRSSPVTRRNPPPPGRHPKVPPPELPHPPHGSGRRSDGDPSGTAATLSGRAAQGRRSPTMRDSR